MHRSALVVGAGIAGLAITRSLASRGYAVTVLDRSDRSVGASIRNFGMIWPIGQPAGALYDRAILSRGIWKEVCVAAGIWHDEVGSIHLAHHEDEWKVLQEFHELENAQRGCQLRNPEETMKISPAAVKENLLGALYSDREMIVDPREAIPKIAAWLAEKYGVKFIWSKAVTDISYPYVYSGRDQFEADEVFICSGADLETLYPEIFLSASMTKCKLQMLRMKPPSPGWRLGPAICGGLTLVHYKSFSVASYLKALKERFEKEYPEYLDWGIHVMVSQSGSGELTIGDSHEYGTTHDPFDKQFINQLILDYLKTFARIDTGGLIETWNGIYPKLLNGQSDLICEPEPGVRLVNGLGGAGMTLAFGLSEEIILKTLY